MSYTKTESSPITLQLEPGPAMIDFLIHFYKIGERPFRSLSALSDWDAVKIMQTLYVEGSVFWERFKDPALYLQQRRQVEEWLRHDFIAKGGKPVEPYPIYMMLGKSKWVLEAPDPVTLATTAEIQLPLSIFKECEVSFTYPDSMISAMLAYEKDPKVYLPEYHGKVFTLSEICSLVEAKGLPGEKWGTDLPSDLANYIEAQVWNRQPLLEYLECR
jgi:hypothetical protein